MDPQLQRLLDDPIFRYSDAMTIGYLVALRGYEEPLAVMENVNNGDFLKGLTLGAEARKGGPVPPFIGYYPDDMMPIKKGQEVTIAKGVIITHRGAKKVNERTRKVKVDHLISGSNFYRNHREDLHPITTPKVVWPGSGGYWSEVDINDVPEAIDAVMEARKQAILVKGEKQIKQMAGVIDEIRSYVAASLALIPKEGFHFRYHGSKEDYFLAEAVTDDHAVLAGFTVEHYYVNRKLTLRINITSSICQSLPNARFIFKALSLVMDTAEKVDTNYCQPWNQAQ
jgi:hypothetical protein